MEQRLGAFNAAWNLKLKSSNSFLQVRKKKKEDMFKKAVNVDAVPIIIESKNGDVDVAKPKAPVAGSRVFKVNTSTRLDRC